MKVSIITPSFNQAAFLEQTILSVLKQNYPDLEYVIIDGGSTDGSLEIIHRYTEQLSWWVSEPDSGQAEAINKGLARTNGEVVAWINSDDLYLPDAISNAVKTLQANPQVSMVYGNAITIDTNGHLLNGLIFTDYDLIDLMAFRIICQPAVFMHRSVLEKALSPPFSNPWVSQPISTTSQPVIGHPQRSTVPHGTTVPPGITVPHGTTFPHGTTVPHFLNPALHYMLDHHLWLRMARLAPIHHINHFLAAARHHPDAKNVAQAPGFGRETLLLLEWMKKAPEFSSFVSGNSRKIKGGAYRLNARYLLDGDLPGPALRWYFRALEASPAYTLHHWHRMLYAAIKYIGLERFANMMRSTRILKNITTRKKDSIVSPELIWIYKEHPDWPGLNFEHFIPITQDG